MQWVMDNAVWKYNTSDPRLEIAVQDEPVGTKENVSVLQIRPSDLGTIADWHEN